MPAITGEKPPGADIGMGDRGISWKWNRRGGNEERD
jgi:hypothetical protein